ncbi:hypothetical protein HYZ70_01610 [Candidatus Curtissbacteria bacterium]|nr:hypothetical protein [Candidatus Curtissbacteria bacterium]
MISANIIVLHGDDVVASDERLTQLMADFKDHLKVRLSENANNDELKEAVLAVDLISPKKIVICQNYLAQAKKIPLGILANVPKDIICIFREKTTLASSKLSSLKKIARVELFKYKTLLFNFLDSLAPKSKTPIKILAEIEGEGLLWQMQKRILLLTLSKINATVELAQKITKRNILDWQWDKIKYQASKFSLESLLALYNATLRIELMIKSGKTNLPESTLVAMMLLKYL